MLKRRGKGKISNDLVAASCLAVLAVYAAGYSRTRDAARRFETQAKERRATTRVEQRVAAARPAVVEAPTPQPAPPEKIAPETAAVVVAPSRPKPSAIARKATSKRDVPSTTVVAAAETSSSNGVPEIAPVPMPSAEPSTPAPIAITREAAAGGAAKWRDGTYTGLGDSPHGDIEARVVIRDGRIVEASIATCDTRYPCSVIDPLIHQPVDRQSPDVDYMSHATESSDAYYYALVAALENAVDHSSGEATSPK